MAAKDRETSLTQIKTNDSVKVILISFKAGSTGLNLTACNNVILVDMWWNPALEDQAFDRAHRLGQTRDVSIYKLKIDATVEDRILEVSLFCALGHRACCGVVRGADILWGIAAGEEEGFGACCVEWG